MPIPTPPLSLPNLTNPPTAEDWNDTQLAIGARLGLPTTSWGQGSIERTLINMFSILLQQGDVANSIFALAGFLDFAATGFVTFVDTNGATVTLLVTPDPSIPSQNPTGALGWLDVLAKNVFDVLRILRTFAGGTLAIVNTSGVTYGPFTPGTYHVTQPNAAGAPGYSNVHDLTIPPSASVAVTGTSINGGAIQVTAVAHGASVGDAVYLDAVGGTIEADGPWFVAVVVDADNLVLQGSTFANAWTSGGTLYLPTVATTTADVPGTASNATARNLVTHPVTSLIGILIGNVDAWLASDTEGNVALANRCRAKLASITTSGPKGAIIYYALTAAQLGPTLTPPQPLATTITRALVALDFTTGTTIVTMANQAGAPSDADVTAAVAVIQAFTTLFPSTLLGQAATNHTVTVSVVIYMPAAFNTTGTQAIVRAAVAAYFPTVDIGGITDPGSGFANVFPIEGVRGAIEIALKAASIPRQDLTVLLNGVNANVQLLLTPTPEVAVLVSPITLTLVSV